MSDFKYTPSDPKIHREGAIARLCAPFQSHEAGIPELLKNSSDEYARLERAEEERVVVLILQN
ncbi:MAG: hypothetical protein ACRD88_22860, partial [Terriglobia bacterium]